MNRTAQAMSWYLWQRNRRSLLGLAGYLLVVVAFFRLLTLGPSFHDPKDATVFCGLAIVAGMIYLMGCFTEVEAYALTLPVRTTSLVLWNTAYGMAGIALVWIASVGLLSALGSGISLPLWPAVLGATTMAAFQACCCLRVRLPYLGLLLLMTFIALPAVIAGIGWASDLPGAAIAGLCLSPTPLLAAIAVYGFDRARRGRAWSFHWNPVFVKNSLAEIGRTRPFAGGTQAQLWLDWQSAGRSRVRTTIYPCIIALIITLLIAKVRHSLELLPGTSILVPQYALVPILFFIVSVLSSATGGPDPDTLRPDSRLQPFFAARPLTTWNLFVGKVRVAALATLVVWGLIALFGFFLLLVPAQDGATRGLLGLILLHHATTRAGISVTALALVLMLWTWRGQVCSLFIGLSGRPWLSLSSAGVLFFQASAWVWAFFNPSAAMRFAHLLPQPALVLAVLKPFAVATAIALLLRRNLAGVATLTRVVVFWFLAVAGLVGLALWLVPSSAMTTSEIVTSAVLLVPITRPLLAPLALDRNRHQ